MSPGGRQFGFFCVWYNGESWLRCGIPLPVKPLSCTYILDYFLVYVFSLCFSLSSYFVNSLLSLSASSADRSLSHVAFGTNHSHHPIIFNTWPQGGFVPDSVFGDSIKFQGPTRHFVNLFREALHILPPPRPQALTGPATCYLLTCYPLPTTHPAGTASAPAYTRPS